MIDSLNRYWLRSGGVYSIAIVRIFLFLAVYYLLFTIILQIQAPTVAEWLENSPTSAYSPKGLVQIFPEKPPSAEFVNIVILVAHVSTVLAIVGLFTRPAMIISTLSVIFLVSLETSFRFYWSHKYNVIC